ncbi:hypothetical protein EVAR_39241_1 [Eumeta japonica]|uniref:Uncharacterized protein n=1 Tax=Eumeta variegata TaxID=151549 RepID=A0A4C1Y0L0_EUMVA|nr:hypothetical protein EVAR_39241_1 [Eumeta japonica]
MRKSREERIRLTDIVHIIGKLKWKRAGGTALRTDNDWGKIFYSADSYLDVAVCCFSAGGLMFCSGHRMAEAENGTLCLLGNQIHIFALCESVNIAVQCSGNQLPNSLHIECTSIVAFNLCERAS